MKISARERMLLFICAFLAINVMGLMYLITPLNSKIDAKKIKIEELNANLNTREVTLNALADVQGENKALEMKFQQIKAQLLEKLYEEEIDEFLNVHISPFTKLWRSLEISDYVSIAESFEDEPIMTEFAKAAVAIVEVQGSQRTTMLIIEHLLNLPQILGVNNITIKTDEQGVITSNFAVHFYHFALN